MAQETYRQSTQEQMVIVYLERHAQGRENAKTARHISNVLNKYTDMGDKGDSTKRATRRFVRNVVDKSKLPIGSCNDGYYIIQDEDELKQTLARLANVRDNIDERMEQLVLSYHSQE